MDTAVVEIFLACHDAIRRGELIRRESPRDKEFHFQDWFQARLFDLGLHFDLLGRNRYPDFTLVHYTEGFEIKGLRYPGRSASYDSNSQIPTGIHNGRDIFYVFGRYPAKPLREDAYPLHDLLICHGDFLNADSDYVHKNRSIKGFGSYGDLMIRDRKMYVAPTPFALTEGTEGQITLILPAEYAQDDRMTARGELVRVEAQDLVVGYTFDLRNTELFAKTVPNPNAGKRHDFVAYRPKAEPGAPVSLARI